MRRFFRETGYVPNKIASGLKKSESKLIGHMTVFSDNMQYEMISDAITRSASKSGYHVLTMTSHLDSETERRQVDQLIGQQVDGVIITSNPTIDSKLITKLTNAGIPVVMIERTQDIPKVDGIAVDDYLGAYEAVSHMIKHGHKAIGFIGIKPEQAVESSRFEGYKGALAKYGIEPNNDWVHYVEGYSTSEGKTGAYNIIKNHMGPMAIFTTSDVLASGVLQYCYQQGLQVPDDISIVGYDNTIAKMLAPPISSMALPGQEIGEEAIRLLFRRMTDKSATEEKVIIKPYLVDRETVLFL